MKNTLFFLFFIFATYAKSQTPYLVKDVNASGALISSVPTQTIEVGGTVYFIARDVVYGAELWKSDGTEAGTVLVKDIRVGSLGSNPQSLTNVNGVLYFVAEDGINGYEVWKSDGTEAGTVMVKDIRVSIGGYVPNSLANVNGTLFFAADDGVNGLEL